MQNVSVGTGLVLLPHQRDGVAWMVNREKCAKCTGGLLLDDCGLGKTPQTIATMVQNPQPATLIVAPVAVLTQWEKAIRQWAPPSFRVLVMHDPTLIERANARFKSGEHCLSRTDILYDMARRVGPSLVAVPATAAEVKFTRALTSAKRGLVLSDEAPNPAPPPPPPRPFKRRRRKRSKATPAANERGPLICIVSYGKLVNSVFERVRKRLIKAGALDAEGKKRVGSTLFHQIEWDRIVLDECHLIRNISTTRTRYVLALSASIRWGLTATPIQNSIADYYCLLKFLKLNSWTIAQIFMSSQSLHKYMTKQAQEMARGRSIDLNQVGTAVVKSGTSKEPFLSHREICLRRTKAQVFQNKRERDIEAVDGENDADNNDQGPLEKRQKTREENDRPVLQNLQLDIVSVDFATAEEESFYRRLERQTQLEVFPENGEPTIIADQAMFELILRLRQATVNPRLVVSGYRRKFGGHFPR